MAPSRQSVLVLLGLVASIRAIPAAAPELDVAARQIELNPPSYSVSWATQPPASTEPPVIEDPDPEDPDNDPDDPVPQPPKPTDEISLSPPSFTVSWDPPLPTTTKKPGFPGWPPRPRPTKKTSTKPAVTATVTWNKRQFDYDPDPTDLPGEPETDPEMPGEPDVPSFPTGKDSIGIQPPKATMTWGKREAKPPPPTFWLGKPTATVKWPKPPKTTGYVSWDKRQDEEGPTEIAPPDGEPTDIAPPQQPDPSDEITFNPPTATITWNKREVEDQYKTTKNPRPTTTKKPKPTTTKKPNPTTTKKPKPTTTAKATTTEEAEPIPTSEYEDEPTDEVPPIPQPSDEISLNPPTATITWGKRDGVEAPPPTFGLGKPTYTFVWPKFPKPTATVTWGKREAEAEAEAQTDSWGVIWPTNLPKPTLPAIPIYTGPGYVSWLKRDASPEPTAAPEPVGVDARAAQFTCGSSTTVSSIRPCPRIGCSPPCVYTPELFEPVPDPPHDPDHTDIRCPIVKTATNKCPSCACPTTFLSILPTKSTRSTKPVTTTKPYPTKPPHPPTITKSVPLPTSIPPSCPTVTRTVVPPCVPPICPHDSVACAVDNVVKRDVVVEKRVVEVETTVLKPTVIIPPTPSKPIVDGCTTAVTKTVMVGCPTYTCVPWHDCSA